MTTLNTTLASDASPSIRATINQRVYFQNMKHQFASSFSVMGELLQNGRRAGAKRISVELDHPKAMIAVTDDGSGVEDFATMLELATSGWTEEEVVLKDKPFGMGFFASFGACKSVVVRSRGRRFEATLDDIMSQRSIPVEIDKAPITVGARIEMHGVNVDLLGPPPLMGKDHYESTFGDRLKRLVKGFSLPVLFNGKELDRPHALDALKTTATAVGHMQISGVHTADTLILVEGTFLHRATKYLQGLPIGNEYSRDESVIVHLDSTRFIAQIPDRKDLYEADVNNKVIEAAIVGEVRRFLVEQKTRLDARTFVSRYWSRCRSFGCSHLLADIPWVPRGVLRETVAATLNTDSNTTNEALPPSNTDGLISRQQLIDEKLQIWSNAPTSSDEDPWAGLAMRLMGHEKILFFYSQDVPKDHWLREMAMDYTCMDFAFEPINAGELSQDFCWQNDTATIRFVDGVAVTVTSSADPTYKLQSTLLKTWVMTPILEPETQQVSEGAQQFVYTHSENYNCWLCRDDTSNDHPVNALATFMDDSDHYREEWENDAIASWDEKVALLRDENLSDRLTRWLGETRYNPLSAKNAQQMAVITVETIQRHTGGYAPGSARSKPLDETTFDQVAAQLLSESGVSCTGAMLLNAFERVVQPGLHCFGPLQGHYFVNGERVAGEPTQDKPEEGAQDA